MKRTSLLIAILLAFFSSSLRLAAQGGCTDTTCYNDSLIISTGYDHNTSTYQAVGTLDDNWVLTGVPSNAIITVPQQPWVINTHPAWSSFPNAKWISPFATFSYGVNNPSGPPNFYTPFVFENCFCLCEQTNVHIKFELMADDIAEAFIDGNLLASALTGWHFQYANRMIVDTIIPLPAGVHCLSVELRNTGGVAMGFTVEGSVTGASLLSPLCCNPTGSICGTKYNDVDCDGNVSTSDPVLSGWTIILYDSLGNPIDTQVTDGYGNYCFNNLPAGTYTVAEVNQVGWTQTYPATGTHTITLNPGDSPQANFGNCVEQPDPCEFQLKWGAEIEDCKAVFTPFIGPLPAGYWVVSAVWTFGDGYSSEETNPIHFYNTPGIYTVCLTVTIFNGEECCIRKWCRDIIIEKPCEGDCHIQAQIDVQFDPRECEYEFTGNVLFTGVPISTWFWDFGDGTTGTGSTITHQFPGPGIYNVCLYLFAEFNGECCWIRVCKEIKVTCDPCKQDPDGKKADPSGNAGQQTQLELFPNPNMGSFSMAFNLAQATAAKMNITDMKGVIVHEQDLGNLKEGRQTVTINTQLAAGTYICRLITGQQQLQTVLIIE